MEREEEEQEEEEEEEEEEEDKREKKKQLFCFFLEFLPGQMVPIVREVCFFGGDTWINMRRFKK